MEKNVATFKTYYDIHSQKINYLIIFERTIAWKYTGTDLHWQGDIDIKDKKQRGKDILMEGSNIVHLIETLRST